MPSPLASADDRPVRVLVLTADPSRLPPAPPAGWWALTAAVPAGRTRAPEGYAVEALRAPAAVGLRRRLRALPTAVSAARAAVGHRAPLAWVWALKRSTTRVRALVEAHDVVVVADEVTDRLLGMLPGVGAGTALVPPGPAKGLLELWAELRRLDARGTGDADDPAPLGDLAGRAAAWQVQALPDALRLPRAVAAVVRGHRERCGLLEGSEVSYVLDGLVDGDDLSGARARRLSAALTLGHVRPEDPAAGDADEVSASTLAAADRALAAGRGAQALDLLTEAMTLLFHRVRHAETPSSPLVDDPAAFLAPLRRSATLADLLRRRRDRSARPPVPQDRAPRVLVMGGAYGDFHGPVAQALEGWAEVRVRDLGRGHLRRTVLTPGSLPRLAALLADRDGAPRLGQDPGGEVDVRAEELLGHLRWADVVLSDWADPATVWLSHLCPRRVRLVLRVHGVDALEPWLHLVRWNRVDRVVVVSEPMRSLVEDVLAGMGVSRPVDVLPNLVESGARLDRPKVREARTTLGLVGWGREVKDPLWALRLLERDPTWRLVLVGPDFPATPAPHQAEYVREVRRLLASPALAGRVTVWGPTDDVGEALRHVGVILSTSRRESWHMGLVEGALSRAVPVVRDWPLLSARGGARALFPSDWVVDDLDAAEARVRSITQEGRWEHEGTTAREEALRLFSPERTAQGYRDLVAALVDPSR